jgi:hypothetical protein
MFQLGILLLMTAADLSQASATAKKTAPKVPVVAAKKSVAIAPLTLPANAVSSAPNQWTHTDAQGKEWIYRQGPFGLTRAPKQAPAVSESRLHEGILVVEQGDMVQFSRQGPFGLTQWSKKLDEVNEVERMAIEKSRAAKSKQ